MRRLGRLPLPRAAAPRRHFARAPSTPPPFQLSDSSPNADAPLAAAAAAKWRKIDGDAAAWSEPETERLTAAVESRGTSDWPGVAQAMGGDHTAEGCRAAWRAVLKGARRARGEVMSPCTKVCKLDRESSTYCYVRLRALPPPLASSGPAVPPHPDPLFAQGCFRDMEAIQFWSAMDNAQKQAALDAAALRRAEHERPLARASRGVSRVKEMTKVEPKQAAAAAAEATTTGARKLSDLIGYLRM